MTLTEDEMLGALREMDREIRFATAADVVPAAWQRILVARQAQVRAETARSLWNVDLLELVPGFAAVLADELADARIIVVDAEPMLAYAVEHRVGDDRSVLMWVGTAPGGPRAGEPTSVGKPVLAQSVPQPIRRFLSDVHGRFTAPDSESFGFRPLDEIETLADVWGLGDAEVTEWRAAPQPRRLLVIFTTYSGQRVCVSPDLSPGMAVGIYRTEGLDSPSPVGELLDDGFDERLVVGE